MKNFWHVLVERFDDIGNISQERLTSHNLTDQQQGIGTARLCDLSRKGFIKEAVTIRSEPNEFEVLESSISMKHGGK